MLHAESGSQSLGPTTWRSEYDSAIRRSAVTHWNLYIFAKYLHRLSPSTTKLFYKIKKLSIIADMIFLCTYLWSCAVDVFMRSIDGETWFVMICECQWYTWDAVGGNVEKSNCALVPLSDWPELQRLLGKVAEFPQTKMGLEHICGHVSLQNGDPHWSHEYCKCMTILIYYTRAVNSRQF